MRFIIACGGTAGHINPGLSVAEKLTEQYPGSEILFVGANGNMEMDLVPRAGYPIRGLDITNLSRGHHMEDLVHNVDTVKNVIHSLHEAKAICREIMPDVVIGTGGYVCYPVLKAASELHIPTAVHESNAVPGLTTKMLADCVDLVMVGIESSLSAYRHSKHVVCTGTPVRSQFGTISQEEAKRQLGLDPALPLVVSVWGSLGSGHMNRIMTEMIPLISGRRFQLIHSTGKNYYNTIADTLAQTAPDMEACGVQIFPYIYNMPCVLTAADLVLCRAGASTLSELFLMEKPALIVPSPNVTNHHQEKNARFVESRGGAKVLLEGQFDASGFLCRMEELLQDPQTLQSMSSAMRSLAVPDAAFRIVRHISQLIS